MALRKADKHYHFDDLEWWAENGLIYIEDHRDGDFNAITTLDAAERATALTVERRKMTAKCISSRHANGNAVLAQEVARLQTAIEGLIEARNAAKKQGDPLDEKVIADLRKARKKHVLYPTGKFNDTTTTASSIILGTR